MGKKQEKIYDESKILYEIYRMRGLTVPQLFEVIFHSKEYGYKWLRRLKEEGYLQDYMDMKGKIRLAKIYTCTDKAIKRLTEEGYIKTVVKAKDNTPPKNKMKYTVLTNEVYAALMPYGIQVLDSRVWKKMNGMDRNSMVRGGLKMIDGREFGLYVFFSPEQISGAKISKSMLTKLKHEIDKFPQTNRFAVICHDSKIYQEVVKAVDSETKLLGSEEMLIIPMGKENFGYNILRMSRCENERKMDLETILNARLNDNHPALQGDKQIFSKFVAEYENKETYVVDFLSMNRTVLHFLSTQYYREIFNKDGREVDLVCWRPNEKELIKRFEQYPHVNIVSISTQELSDTYISKMEKTKLE